MIVTPPFPNHFVNMGCNLALFWFPGGQASDDFRHLFSSEMQLNTLTVLRVVHLDVANSLQKEARMTENEIKALLNKGPLAFEHLVIFMPQ